MSCSLSLLNAPGKTARIEIGAILLLSGPLRKAVRNATNDNNS